MTAVYFLSFALIAVIIILILKKDKKLKTPAPQTYHVPFAVGPTTYEQYLPRVQPTHLIPIPPYNMTHEYNIIQSLISAGLPPMPQSGGPISVSFTLNGVKTAADFPSNNVVVFFGTDATSLYGTGGLAFLAQVSTSTRVTMVTPAISAFELYSTQDITSEGELIDVVIEQLAE